MQHKHKLAVALSLLVVIGTVEVAQARMKIFRGTRGQVADACNGPSRTFSFGQDGNGIGWSMCVDTARNTSVICDDRESCVGIFAASAKPRKPRGNFEPPQSLSEQSSGGGVPTIDPPPVNPDTDVVIIN